MATWCSSCRIQQREAVAALEATPSDKLVYVGVDVDPNQDPADLAEYARREGFDWRFIVASRDVARSLAATFGDQVLSPPSTPLILVGPDGDVVDFHFGIRDAADLEALFREHLP
jgi:thiol-disulfide isomerase/thioredoxin